MKKNRIIAGLSALMMGATMMSGAAMSASAKSFTPAGGGTADGGFWAYYDTDGDGTKEWAVAPTKFGIDMYDATINTITDNTSNSYTIGLKTAGNTFVSGTVTSIRASSTGPNLISGNSVTLNSNVVYYMDVDAKLMGVTVHTSTMEVKFVVS